jgi:hypothetical protein
MEQEREEIREGLRQRPTLWPASDLFIRVMTSRNLRARLLVLMALALVIRLVAVLMIDDPHTVPRNLEESDAPGYYVLADHLLDGTGYRYAPGEAPSAKRAPGYPLFLAAIFKVSSRNFTAVRIMQCLVDVATVYLVFGLSLLLFGSGAAALLAAFAYTIYFPAIQNTTYILPETTHTFFLVGAVTLAVLAMRAGSYFLYAVAGIIFGVATMIRPGAYLLPVVLLAVGIVVTPWVGLDRGVGRVLGDRRSAGIGLVSWRGLLILLAGFVVTMFPWVMRNQQALGRPVITTTLAGANLYKGNHVPTGGAYPWAADSLFTPDLKARTARVSEVEKDRILRAETRKMILSHKAAVALITLKKIPGLWLNLGIQGGSTKKSIALASAHLIILGLALYALLGIAPDARRLSFVPITTVAFSTATYLAVPCAVRLVYPLIPVVLPYSALGLARIGTRLGLGRKPER